MEVLVRFVVAMTKRVHSLILGTQVPAEARVLNCPEAPEDSGVALELLGAKRHTLAVWLNPAPTWKALSQSWGKRSETVNENHLSTFYMGGMQTLLNLLGKSKPVPELNFIVPGVWDQSQAMSWRSIKDTMVWIGILSPGGKSWLGIEKELANKLDQELTSNLGFRDEAVELVLGESCGRVGMERSWQKSKRGPINIESNFPFGPCLLPPRTEGETKLIPVFTQANPDPRPFDADKSYLVHTTGWAGLEFSVIYEYLPDSQVPTDDPTASTTLVLNKLLQDVHRLMDFSYLVDGFTDRDDWQLVQGVQGSAESWLAIHAHYPGKILENWTIYLPSTLLSELSTNGLDPWNWKTLWANADNLLQVFMSALQRHVRHSPTGKSIRNPSKWMESWWDACIGSPNTVLNQGRPDTMVVSDLLTMGNTKDVTILVQNVLLPAIKSLSPLSELFYWIQEDTDNNPITYKLPDFNHQIFQKHLPPELGKEFDKRLASTWSDLLYKNDKALALIWKACKNGSAEFSPRFLDALKASYIAPLRMTRELRVRALARPSLGPLILAAGRHPNLTMVLQQDGPDALAQALLYDSDAESAVAKHTSKGFFAQYSSTRARLLAQPLVEGPDADTMERIVYALHIQLDVLVTSLNEEKKPRR